VEPIYPELLGKYNVYCSNIEDVKYFVTSQKVLEGVKNFYCGAGEVKYSSLPKPEGW